MLPFPLSLVQRLGLHIAFGSIRMEPVFMVLGQSAATAAVLAIENKVSLQKLPYEKLREVLLKNKQVLEN